jgi:hypothetical protein
LPYLLAVHLPEFGVVGNLLARRQDIDRDQSGLALQYRLRRGEPVVVGRLMEDRIEWEILTLERMDHLMGQDQPKLRRIGAGDPEQGGWVRVVVSGYLLGVEVQQQRAEPERVGEEPEQAVSRLQPPQLRCGELLVQLADEIGPYLLPGAERWSGWRLEVEAGGPLDRQP